MLAIMTLGMTVAFVPTAAAAGSCPRFYLDDPAVLLPGDTCTFWCQVGWIGVDANGIPPGGASAQCPGGSGSCKINVAWGACSGPSHPAPKFWNSIAGWGTCVSTGIGQTEIECFGA